MAKAGLTVLVLERRSVPGGACITEEQIPGYRFSTAAYSAGLLRPEIIRDLKLKELGLKFIVKDPQYFLPYTDGKYLFLWVDRKKSAKEIEKLSRKDAKSYLKFCGFWDRFVQIFEPFILRPPPTLGELFRKVKGEDEEILRAVFFQSARQFLDELFESDQLKAALATQGIIGTFSGPSTPGTVYVMAHHMLCEVNGEKGVWGVPKGGMGSITATLAKAAEGNGATIQLNSEVEKVEVKRGRAVGVRLKDGRVIMAKVVLSNADPKRTFLGLVGPENLDREFARRVEALKTESAVVKVNCALNEPPDYKACPGKALGPQHRGSMEVAPSIAYLERAWNDATRGKPSEKPWLEVEVPTAIDRSLAPAGKHILSIFSQYGPYHLKHGEWDGVRDDYGDRVIEALAEYAPNVKESLHYRQVLAPPDLERIFGLTDGNIFHGEITPDQVLSSRPFKGSDGYRTPVKNLYLCGSGTHPGGGVMGAPGHNAAQAVITDWKKGKVDSSTS